MTFVKSAYYYEASLVQQSAYKLSINLLLL